MTNAQLAAAFDEMADLLEFQGANSFRVRAYRNASRAIQDLPESIETIVHETPQRLEEIPAIGKAVAEKCVVLVTTGHLPQLEELRREVPESVLALLRIPGVGPKKAAALHKELGVGSLDDLKRACTEGRVRALKGFGEKTEKLILDGMAVAEQAGRRVLWCDADTVAQALRAHLAIPAVRQLELAGSYRRGQETVGDLDVLVDADDVAAVMDRFATFPDIAAILGRGETKMSVRLGTGFQVDLRVVPPQSFGAALQYFTGSKNHNVELRSRAKQASLKVNEYGVFAVSGEEERYVAGATEAEVYAALGLPWIPPELRENRQEFRQADEGQLPALITREDILGDLHMHTTATDGKATLEEMVAAAQERGLSYIAITDHSQRVSMARGLDPERLLAQWAEIDRLNERLGSSFQVLKGIECDILEKGGMDLPDDVLAQADWVLASIHYGQKQPRSQITERLLGAIENPRVRAIAHPTGRLLNHREPYDVDLDAVFAAVKQHRKLLELNASPERLDLNDVLCARARNLGIPIVIDTDAHSIHGLDAMRFGILQARRASLTKRDVANTRPWSELKQLFG